jgi:putative FmdB family regulatory protein
MPIYEYKCNSCGKKFEKIEKFSAAPLEIHEGCGGPVERLISAPALQFKGTGWYVTDYAKSNSSGPGKNGSDPKSDSKDGSKSESKSDSGSSDSKSDSKSESKSSDSSSSSTSTSTPSTSSSTSTAEKK